MAENHVPVTVLEVTDDYGIVESPPRQDKRASFARTIRTYIKQTCCGASSCCKGRPDQGNCFNTAAVERSYLVEGQASKRVKATRNATRDPWIAHQVKDHYQTLDGRSQSGKSHKSQNEICLAPPTAKDSRVRDGYRRDEGDSCAEINDVDERGVLPGPKLRPAGRTNLNSPSTRISINSPLKYTSV